MRQAEIVVGVKQGHLLAQTVLALAQRAGTTANRRHVLTEIEIEALHKGRVDLPATRCQHVVDTIERAAHHPVRHADQAPSAYRLHHVRLEQLWQGHPAGLGPRACGLTPLRLYPGAKMCQHRRHGFLESIRQTQGSTVGC